MTYFAGHDGKRAYSQLSRSSFAERIKIKPLNVFKIKESKICMWRISAFYRIIEIVEIGVEGSLWLRWFLEV